MKTNTWSVCRAPLVLSSKPFSVCAGQMCFSDLLFGKEVQHLLLGSHCLIDGYLETFCAFPYALEGSGGKHFGFPLLPQRIGSAW